MNQRLDKVVSLSSTSNLIALSELSKIINGEDTHKCRAKKALFLRARVERCEIEMMLEVEKLEEEKCRSITSMLA